MRVALDATPLTLSSGGLRRYTEQLAHALATEYPHDVFTLLSPAPISVPSNLPPNLRVGPPPHTRLEHRWWLFGAPLTMRRRHIDLFHGTNFEVPYPNLRPSVLTLHDLSPWRDPLWHHNADRIRQRTPWLIRLGIATMVITPSEAIRREAMDRFSLSPERVVAIPHASSRLNAQSSSSAPQPTERPFFLFVGTVEPRKNLDLLLDAWRAVNLSHQADLVLAGRRRADGRTFEPEPGLKVLGEVTDLQLAALYRDAIALVYPSHYEGFGLPVLEAMEHGAVAVISRDPALLEIGGDAALCADSVRDWTSTMRALLVQPALRAHHRELGFRRAAQFSWAACARNTHAVYGEALARFG